MSTLLTSQVNRIGIQSDVESIPLDNTLQNLKNAINDNQLQITNIVTPASGAEVVNARNNMSVLKNNIELRQTFGDRIVESDDFQVTESGPAANTVDVDAGSGIVLGIGVTKASSSTSSVISPAAAGKNRIDVVYIDTSNTINIASGTEVVGTPAWPTIASSQMALGHFTVDDTAPVVISDADITDDRIPLINPFEYFDNFDKTYIYDGSQNLTSFTVVDKKGTTHTFTITYAGGLVDNIAVTISGVTYTETYTYDGNDNVITSTYTVT